MAKMVTFDELVSYGNEKGKTDVSVNHSLLHMMPSQFMYYGYKVTLIHDECYRVSTRSSSLLVTPKDVLVFTSDYVLVGKTTMNSTL
jgi:hypothetical protein